MSLDESQVRRYSRHVLLPDVGGVGQERLLGSSVRIDVTPPCPAAIVAIAYLAAGGVGRLVLSGETSGAVTAEEAATGVLFGSVDRGLPRHQAISERVAALNPDVSVVVGESAEDAAGQSTLLEVVGGADSVADSLIVGARAAARLMASIARAR